MREPLARALGCRGTRYRVRIEWLGRRGEAIVAIDSAKGRLPLLFGGEELEPGYVVRVVTDTADRFAF